MATFGGTLRRGLPRTPGGEPWPPAGVARGAVAAAEVRVVAEVPVVERARTLRLVADAPRSATDSRDETPVPAGSATSSAAAPADASATVAAAAAGAASAADAAASAAAGRAVRRGLPRTPGGEPWPPASFVPSIPPSQAVASAVASPQIATTEPATPEVPSSQTAASAAANPHIATAEPATPDGKALRRGLPRTPGGEPWPPAGLAPVTVAAPAPVAVTDAAPGVAAEAAGVAETEAAASEAPHVEAAQDAPTTATGVPLDRPLPFARTVWAGKSMATRPEPKPEPTRIGPFTRGQWAGVVIVGGAGLLYAAGMAVFAVRWLLSTSWGVDFLAAFPGEYHLPEGAPVGFPAWLGWQHFFNVFLMVLVIRTGLTVRTEKRPTVFWSPRSNGRRKISLTLWFHQSLDILWLVNGVIFVALLFVTGQWLRIVPTSWEVFPNALSAALQYVSLDWPTENGWVNYNALQQLAYFTTVFLAAPLAALTGVRMSGIWPKNAAGLNKAYPVEWARAVHFPVMLYFVVFIAVHVFLVFATGALRNLNHMYAAQGSTDPNAYADNWTGFWLFVASLVVIAAAWVAARPLVLAPIARLFGKVSGR